MSGQNIELGIKLRYDGKEVDAGISLSRESLQKFAAETKRAGSSASESFNAASASASSFGSVLKGAIGAVSTGALVYGIKSATMSLIDAQQAAQKLRNSLEYSAGSAGAAASEIAYLRDVTRTLGLDFATASVAYSKFAAATKDSGISAAQTKTVFEGIAAASARMGLSADETSGALLALSQMASKGTVQAEELRGQLGERLPGSFNIAAKAMGVTTAELGKMLEQGQVLASDFLPKFGEALKSQFQAPLNSLTQEINRMSSAWALWKTELSEGSDGGGFKWLTNGLNESAAAMHALGNEAGITHKILVAIGGFGAGALGNSHFDTRTAQEQALEKLTKAKERLAALEEKQSRSNLNQIERTQLEHYTASVKAATEELSKLEAKRRRATAPSVDDRASVEAAQKAAADARASAYLGDSTNGSKAAKIAAEVEKENKAFKTAVAGFSETDARYVKMLAEHNARIKEINAKAKPAAGTSNDTKQEFDALLAAEKAYSETQVTLVKQRVAQGLQSEEDGIKAVLAAKVSGYMKERELLQEQLAKTSDAGDKKKLEQQIAAIGSAMTVAAGEYTTALAKMDEAGEKYRRRAIESIDAATAKTEEENATLRTQIDTLGMTSAQLGEYEASKIRAAASAEYLSAANAREAASTLEAAGEAADSVQFYKDLADARSAAAKALSDKATLTAQKGIKQSAVDAAKEWEKTSDKISDSLTDALMRGFESGKSFAKNLRDATVNMFSTMVLRPVVQATVVGGLNAVGLGPGTAAASDASGGYGNYLSAANSAYNLYSGGSAASSFASNFALSSAGSALGLSTGLSTSLGVAGGAGTTMGASAALAAAESTAAGATALTAAGSTALAAIPYVGWALAAVAAISSMMGKRGGAKEGGGAGFDIINGVAAQSTANGGRGASAYYTPNGGDAALAATLAPIANSAAALVKSIGGSLEGYSFSLGYDKDPKGTAGSRITSLVSDASGRGLYGQTVDTGRDDAAFAAAMQAELQREIIAAVKSANVAQIYKDVAGSVDIMTASADDLSVIVTKLGAITTLREAFEKINLGADALTTTLISSAGGLDTLATATAGYYDGYFSDAEKQSNLQKSLADQFETLNVAMPTTRAEFRTLVEEMDKTTAAGQKTAGSLLAMSSTFGTWADAAKKAAEEAATAAAAVAEKAAAAAAEKAAAAATLSGSIRKAEVEARRALQEAEDKARADKVTAYKDGEEAFTTLRSTLLNAGDAAGALSESLKRAFANPSGKDSSGYDLPAWKEGTTAAGFNYQYGVLSATLARDLANELSANALSVQNVGKAMGSFSVEAMNSWYNPVTGAIAANIRDAIVKASGDTSAVVRDAVSDAALSAAMGDVRAQYQATGPGLASIAAARSNMEFVGQGGYVGGKYQMGGDVLAYGGAIDKLSSSLKAGKINTEQYDKAVAALSNALPTAADLLGDLAAQTQRVVDAAAGVERAGMESIQFYFDSLHSLATALTKTDEPVNKVVASIGRLNSFNTAFGESASAAGYLGATGGNIDKAQLIADSAAIAAGVLTTSTAAEAAKKLAASDAFAGLTAQGIRDASLLLDGVTQYNPDSFENAFIRISDALAQGYVTDAQYKALFDTALDTFKGVDAEASALTTSMEHLRDAMSGFAASLLVDAGKTTLTATQTRSELMRQYETAYTAASTGDSDALTKYQSLANEMLDKSRYASPEEYAAAFGHVYGDAKSLETVAIKTLAAQKGDNVVDELKTLNKTLTARVESLEKTLETGLAVIAKNTAKTSQGIDQINTVGIPA